MGQHWPTYQDIGQLRSANQMLRTLNTWELNDIRITYGYTCIHLY